MTALPTFFVIGAPKAGTTSLHHYLDQHPKVQMSAVKEPRYFVESGGGLPPPVEQVTDRAEYESLFDPAVAVRGESSTDYTTHPRRYGAPERIRELVPSAKFIYLVRDPVARTVSHFKMRVAAGGESRPLEAALCDLDDPTSPYVWPSLYATQLERYLELFPPERFLIVDQANLLSDRQATLAEIFGFLGVGDVLDPRRFEAELHEGHELRAYPSFYAHTVNRVIGRRAQWVPAGLRRGTRRTIERMLWPPRDVSLDDRLRRRLEGLYSPEAARLRELTGKTFPDLERLMSALTAIAEPIRRSDFRIALAMLALIGVLVVQGIAVTHSYLLAAPILAVIVVAIAVDLPLVPVMATALAVRVLTDASVSSEGIRSTGAINLSALIALFFILLAIGLMLQRRQGVWAAVLALAWISATTAVAVASHSLDLVTLREGVREASVVAAFMIVYNSRGVLSVAVVTRIVQLIGTASATVAIYQFATGTGMLIGGELRAHGTLVHPDAAAVFFAIAATASFWRYFELGRRRSDLLLGAICAAGTIVTFSLAGLAGFLVMLAVLGAMRPAPLHAKLQAAALAALILAAFLATPLGSERISEATSTKISTESQLNNSSLGWRFHTWGVLIRDWQKDPLMGKGLGISEREGTAEQQTEVNVPHNEYLRYLVDTGVIGILLLGLGVAALIRALLARLRSLGPSGAPARSAAALALAIVAGCLVDALASNTFSNTTNGYAIAMIVASALSVPAAIVSPAADLTGR